MLCTEGSSVEVSTWSRGSWKNVMWSDETKIDLFGAISTRHVWRKKKAEWAKIPVAVCAHLVRNSKSANASMMNISELSLFCKWENLQNHRGCKYLWTSLYVYCKVDHNETWLWLPCFKNEPYSSLHKLSKSSHDTAEQTVATAAVPKTFQKPSSDWHNTNVKKVYYTIQTLYVDHRH